MAWPRQSTRYLIYRLAPAPLLVGLLFLGVYRWVAIVLFVGLLLAAAFEMCARCGGSLMIFGAPRRDDGGHLVCRRCAKGAGGFFG